MRNKLGLLSASEQEDETLFADLLETMANTGADFTSTFRVLARVPLQAESSAAEESVLQ